MQLRELTLERYKGYREQATLVLRPVTILVGRNNSGKTALARALPLLAGGLLGEAGDPLPLESFGLTHGSSFRDLVTNRSLHGSLRLGARYEHQGAPVGLDVVVQGVAASAGGEVRQLVMEWNLTHGNRTVSVARADVDLASRVYQLTSPDGTVRDLDVNWLGLVPAPTDDGWPDWASHTCTALQRWAQGMRYLACPRRLMDSPFRLAGAARRSADPEGLSADPEGLSTVVQITSSDSLALQIRDWFRKTFGVVVEVRKDGDFGFLEVRRDDGHQPALALAQSGQGLAHVLPVAVRSLTSRTIGQGVDVVEHPEAELHPGAHTAIAELLLAQAPGAERPLVIETHSEMLLLRARRAVAEGRLTPDDVSILWIDQGADEDTATVRRIHVTATGEVEDWPEGVFYEDYEEILAIRRAARGRAAP